MLHTTLKLLKRYQACEPSFTQFRAQVGDVPDNQLIPLTRVLELRGLEETLWAFCAVPKTEQRDRDRISRLLACDYAERVLPLYETQFPGDTRSRDCIAVSRRFAVGEATKGELNVAWSAALSAADAAWSAAQSAADDETRWQTEKLKEYLNA